jgi:hypothetical protein
VIALANELARKRKYFQYTVKSRVPPHAIPFWNLRVYKISLTGPPNSGGVDRISVTSENGFSVNPSSDFWSMTQS